MRLQVSTIKEWCSRFGPIQYLYLCVKETLVFHYLSFKLLCIIWSHMIQGKSRRNIIKVNNVQIHRLLGSIDDPVRKMKWQQIQGEVKMILKQENKWDLK